MERRLGEFGLVLWQGRGRNRRRGGAFRLMAIGGAAVLAALAGAGLIALHGSTLQVMAGAALIAPIVLLLAGPPFLALLRWFAT